MNCFLGHKPRIAVFAPAGPLPEDKIQASLALFAAEQVECRVLPHVFAGHAPESYLAATVVERAADFNEAFVADTNDWLLALRGGYGTVQILEYLQYPLFRGIAKPVIGYSDLTALLLALEATHCGTPISAPMAGKFAHLIAQSELNLRSFQKALDLCAGPLPIAFDGRTYNAGHAKGLPMVLNLTVAASLCGTPFMPKFDQRIVILEDLNEPPYRIDRCLQQLMLSGAFDQVQAVLFGDFINCGNSDELQMIFTRLAAYGNFPVADNFPFGHGDRVTSINWHKEVEFATADNHSVLTIQ